MATSQARRLHLKEGKRVFIIGIGGRPQWSPVFENNPRISRTREPGLVVLRNGPGLRPYIAGKTPERWTWRTWDKEPGEICLTHAEKRFGQSAAGRILIEPQTKVPDGNKAWPWARWQAVADAMPGEFVQVGQPGSRKLEGVQFVDTTFRQACAVIAWSRAFVGTEGGLHHAAAAFGKPAVVLFSEFISPEITGYDGHRNLRHAGEPCGARLPCAGCAASMQAITVDEVLTNLREIV